VYVAPKSPKKWHKTRFCYFFPANFNICRKKSATKFLGVKTSSSKVVATSFLYFLYLTVHRWIAGDVPIHRKFVLKVTHRFRKSRFRQISLNCATSVRASEKSSIIANKWSTTSFPPSHTSVTPKSPKGWLKTRKFFTSGVAFYFFVAGNRRLFKFNMWVERRISQPTDDKLSLKWAWPHHVTHFKLSVCEENNRNAVCSM